MIQIIFNIFLLCLMACQEPQENPFEEVPDEQPYWHEKALEESGFYSSSSFSSSSYYHTETLNSAGQLVINLGNTETQGSPNQDLIIDSLDFVAYSDNSNTYLKICLAKHCDAKNYYISWVASGLYPIDLDGVKSTLGENKGYNLIHQNNNIIQAIDFSRTGPWKMKKHSLDSISAGIALALQVKYINDINSSLDQAKILYIPAGIYQLNYISNANQLWQTSKLHLIGNHPSTTKLKVRHVYITTQGTMSHLSLGSPDTIIFSYANANTPGYELNDLTLSSSYIKLMGGKSTWNDLQMNSIFTFDISKANLIMNHSILQSWTDNPKNLMNITGVSSIQFNQVQLLNTRHAFSLEPNSTLIWDGGKIQGTWQMDYVISQTGSNRYLYIYGNLNLRNLQVDLLSQKVFESHGYYQTIRPDSLVAIKGSFSCNQIWGQSPISNKDTLYCGKS